jgi:two-component system CheB/CheR fusion protein
MTDGRQRSDEKHGQAGERDERGLDVLLDFLDRERGFDFSSHKRHSLVRRIRRRMTAIGSTSFSEYHACLELNPDELSHLFDMLLINVTAFFRDPLAWQTLASRLPSVIDLHADTPIRAWSAGCSSGEEPYTLAMVLCEALGEEAFSRRVKIYATDVDEEALSLARQATYSEKALEAVPAKLVAKYFTASGSHFTVRKELRRDVTFGRHDLVQDAPIAHVDVLVCRNSLMYFNAATQRRVIERLQLALNPGGLLFLGKAEMLLSHSELFTPLDLKRRLFQRSTAVVQRRDKTLLGGSRGSAEGGTRDKSTDGAPGAPARPAHGDDPREELRRAAFDASPRAEIVVDTAGRVALANRQAVRMFSLSGGEVGRAFDELALAHRPADLSSLVVKARVEGRPVRLREVERVLANGEKTFLDIEVAPLVSESGALFGTQVSFADVTSSRRLRVELRRANLELEAAQEELRSMTQDLQRTNEDLQSANEELATTKEELHSSNEELETMNEELQATNEELETFNEELRQRGTELNEVNAFFRAVIASFDVGIAVLDRDLRVVAWNDRMVSLWEASAKDVTGEYSSKVGIGLPTDEIAASLRACLAVGKATTCSIDCTNARGEKLRCRATSVAPLRGEDIRGVIVLVDTAERSEAAETSGGMGRRVLPRGVEEVS